MIGALIKAWSPKEINIWICPTSLVVLVIKLETENQGNLSAIVDFENIRARINSLKKQQNELSKAIAEQSFNEEYKKRDTYNLKGFFTDEPQFTHKQTFNFASGEVEPLVIKGRHDVCIALRAAVVVESAIAIALADLKLRA